MSQNKTQELLDFVRQLPVGFAYAPIYAKGKAIQSGKISKGKTPLEKSHHSVLNPIDVAYHIGKQPQVFQAVGAFTGPRSKGLVILDVDRNLSKLKKKWGDTLDGAPVIESTKANAAKYLFMVPEEFWDSVKGFGLSDTGAGYEVLWGRQGLLFGAYPGSQDGKAPAGTYGFTGDLENIPVVPDWLLAEMRDSASKGGVQDGGFIKNRAALDFSERDPAEVAEIIQCALNVIPGQGAGSRDHWIKVGMAIHSELPTDLGLTLWSAWSAEDPEFSDEWSGGNPCKEVWNSFKKGAVTLGTLFWMADQQRTGRTWLPEDLRKVVADVEGEGVLKIRNVQLSYAEVIKRAKEIQQLDNPAEMAHKMNSLALEAGYRDAGALERLLISQIQYELRDDDMDIGDLLDKDVSLEYLIPDLLPKPGLVMIHGAGGDGKSMTAWTLAKHVARGLPFTIRKDEVPVQKGPVLILNGDQSEVQVKQQMEDLDLCHGDPIRVVMGWDLNWYMRFVKLIEKHQPSLVIIDSITGCSRGSAFDENRKEFAGPLYWLANNNGRLFPACTILVVHHSNKAGGFRGTTALRDSCDEVWSLRKPSEKELQGDLNPACRLITIEKSRAGRGGSRLLLKMQDDLTFSLIDFTPVETDANLPASVIDRVLARVRVSTHAGEGRSHCQLKEDPLVGGTSDGIKKALQRLEKRGLLFSTKEPSPIRAGTMVNVYRAVVSRDMCVNSCPPKEKPSGGLESVVGQVPENEEVVPPNSGDLEPPHGSGAQKGGHENGCPSETTSVYAGFDQGDSFSVTPQGEERSPEALDVLMEQAAELWD